MSGRTIEKVLADVKSARIKKQPLNWPVQDTAEDMEIVCAEIIVDIQKVKKGNKASAKRVRDYTKVMETLGKDFRLTSVKL